MRQTRTSLLALFASLIFISFTPHAARAQVDERSRALAQNAPQISYTVSMPKPQTHLLEIQMQLRYANGAPGAVSLRMPVWTPGSYKVRDFAKNVQDFSAGRHAWRKVDKSRWRVAAGGDVTVEYDVWAFELSVQSSHVSSTTPCVPFDFR